MPLLRRGLIARAAAGSDGPLPTQDAEIRARRRLIVFAGLGIVSYALAMVATMPASVFLKNYPWRTGISGTVWNGEVGVAGGTKFEWQWSPLRSLTSLGFAANWTATGPDTDLGGRVLAGFGGTTLDKVSGAASGRLLETLQPSLPFACELVMQVEFEKIALGGSDRLLDGKVTTDPGSCRPKTGAGAATAVPALLLTAEHVGNETRLAVTPLAQRRKVLVSAVLARDGTMDLTVTPDGAAALPFLGAPPGARIQGKM